MINKLIYSHIFVLQPLLLKLKAVNYSENLIRIQELEQKMKDNSEQSQVLTGLLTKGYLNPAFFNAQNNELRKEAAQLKEQKKALSRSVNGGMAIVTEVEQILKFASKSDGRERKGIIPCVPLRAFLGGCVQKSGHWQVPCFYS